jgi:prolyl oligopeptidase
MNRTLPVFVAVALSVHAAYGLTGPTAPPATPKQPVTDEYQGEKIVDPYRWLENGDDPKVKAWSDAQNAYARGVLDALPHVAEIRARLTELENAASTTYGEITWKAGKLFAIKNQPPKQQPFLVVLTGPDETGSERVVVDPNVLDAKGGVVIDFYAPSPDGKLVAVSLSHGGTEEGDVHVYDVETGAERGDAVPRVNGGTAGGGVSWAGDSKGLFYTRYPRQGEKPEADMGFFQQVYFHALGEPTAKDRYEIGKDFPRIAEVKLETSEDGKWVLASVQKGDGGEFAHYLRAGDGKWTQVTAFEDRVVHAALGHEGDVFLLSRAGAPRGKVLRLKAGEPLAKAAEVVPQSAPGGPVVVGLVVTPHRLYVTDQIGGPSQLRTFALDGKDAKTVDLPPVTAVGQVAPLAGDEVMFRTEMYTSPVALMRYDPAKNTAARTALSTSSSVDYTDTEVVRETATSKDGTKVPVNIIMKKGTKLDGSSPTVLSGYGGYGVSMQPGFSARRRIWIDQGGVLAIANIRGGSEFGDEWHLAGNLAKKQNVFDDFAAAMKHLVDRKYTSKEKLAIMGGSNGGLLMGAMLVQHPDMFKACVSSVGIYDMLRVELHPNGAFNVTEFGTVKNPEHYKAMRAYSPYHNVKDGAVYPPVLFLTGASDPRVDPYHSRKMTARLQEAEEGKGTVLLRTSAGGHGGGTPLSQRIEQGVDIYAFLFDRLGVDYKPVQKKGA